MSTDPALRFIDALKRKTKTTNDQSLADRLGIGKSTVASWRVRRKIPRAIQERAKSDFDLDFEKIEEESMNDFSTAHKVLDIAFYLAILRLGASLTPDEMLEFASWIGSDPHPMWKLVHGGRKSADDLWDADESRMIEVLTKVVAGSLATPADIRALKADSQAAEADA